MRGIEQFQREGTGLLTSFLGAIVLVFGVSRVSSLFPDSASLWPLAISILAFALLAMAIQLIYLKSKWSCIVAILAGIPIGTILDVMWDWSVNSVDRNLFPIEILMWLVLAVIPVTIGFFIGRKLGHKNAQP